MRSKILGLMTVRQTVPAGFSLMLDQTSMGNSEDLKNSSKDIVDDGAIQKLLQHLLAPLPIVFLLS